MVIKIFSQLGSALKNTASRHKKKLIAAAIIVLGAQIVRRRIKTQQIISIIMFLLKFWSRVLDLLPIPADPGYRHIQPFKCVKSSELPELANLIDLKILFTKIKNKQEGALNQLKSSVFSAVMLNIVLYKVNIIYDTIQRKYAADFVDLGSATEFQQAINLLKIQFIKNLTKFRHLIASWLGQEFQKVSLNQMVDSKTIAEMFRGFMEKLFADSIDISQKVLVRKTHLSQTKQYKIADNYFRTTKEYVQQKPKKLSEALKFILAPPALLVKSISYLLKAPEVKLTSQRFSLHECLYILPLKKFSYSQANWPVIEAKYLFDKVIEELTNVLYSINFNMLSHKYAQLMLKTFNNRVGIYFMRRAKCEKKKVMELLPIFYKIMQEELVINKNQKDFYEHELINAFKDTKKKHKGNQSEILPELRLRNEILIEIYLRNEFDHAEKDMQAKLYNEREGLIIEPVARSSRIYEQKDEVQMLMNIYDKADVQKENPREQLRMMRELVQ